MSPVAMGEKGWPRPRAEWRDANVQGQHSPYRTSNANRCPELPHRLPVPWLVDLPDQGWTGFRDDACEAARARLCMVCGEPVTGTLVLGYYNCGTSGPGGHPRCMLLAATCCPRLVEEGGRDGQVAWRYDGPGAGHQVPEDVNDGYGDGEAVAPEAIPLTLAELRQLVRDLGRLPAPTAPINGAAHAARAVARRNEPRDDA